MNPTVECASCVSHTLRLGSVRITDLEGNKKLFKIHTGGLKTNEGVALVVFSEWSNMELCKLDIFLSVFQREVWGVEACSFPKSQ